MRLLIFLCLPIFSFAQWKVSGYILDEANLPYQHIEIRITQLNLTVFTDQKGFYLFDSIPSGSYALSIDYGYDTEYRKIDVLSQNVNFSVVLERRINFDEIVVYGDKWHQQQAVSQISLNENAIRDLDQTKDLPYTLNALPSAQVQSDAGNGLGYTGIRLRGVDPTHIQINLNGIPMNDAESSIAYFVDIPDILTSTDE
ncbi:MAG TPA: carboxypeptidase-like regulatory domain-containing protein, partial [Saprospiraceae bacterium]|nr:carboxypeptidase-like regulatory domain-containing protein [Saprospiraceae bacterium]